MLERIPKSPPKIDPITDTNRPRWSVMIPTYNCYPYIKEAIESVLKQDPGEAFMQIEVVDDCSTDGNVEALVKEWGRGRVTFYKQQQNVGSLRNFETCIKRARGLYIHLLHGDDLVKRSFYKEVAFLFNTYPDAGAVIVKNAYINSKGYETGIERQIQEDEGIIHNWLEIIATRQRLQPPAIVIKRSVYEHLGSFFGAHYGEDWEMYTRIAAHYPVVYTPKYLAKYRVHTNNITSNAYAKGQHVKDLKTIINIIQNYLPANKKQKIKRNALKIKSIWFAKHANAVYTRNPNAAVLHVKHALQLNFNVITAGYFIYIYVKKWLDKNNGEKAQQ